MKKILFSVAMAFVLVSCSHDEVIEINRDGDEIQFNVVSDAATRAANVYCNNNMPTKFRVWAFTNQPGVTDGAPYIVGDHIERQGEEAPYTWKNIDGTRYWPKEGNLTFVAEVNADDYVNDESYIPFYFEDYKVPENVADQKDLMYAVTNCSKGTVNLNFRHALSQIVFRAQNNNDNLHVVIEGVTVCKLASTGTLTLGSYYTDGNIKDHTGNGTLADRNGWKVSKDINAEILAGGNTDYSVTFEPVSVPYGDPISLTSANDSGKEFSSKAMLLLPQTTTAWAPATGNAVPADQEGTYFLVDCKIYNVTYPDKGYQPDYEADLLLHEGPAAIPARFDWKEGKKYTYTFVFGKDGNGGFDPDPDEDPDIPEPVLTPITFNVTVDDFVAVENKDYEYDMTTKN